MIVRGAPQASDYEVLVSEERLVNHYQPIIDLRSGAVIGVETLARLRGTNRLILPGDFLPNLGHEALEKLLFTSLRQGLAMLRCTASSHPDLFIALNVSPNVMLRPGFLNGFLRTVASAAIDPARVTLEILESDEFLHLPAARHVLDALHEIGVRLAIDDVGAGYSSLVRLRNLPVETIKLDQSFVCELQRNPESLHFVSAMLSLSRGLRKLLIVEGVETDDIRDALGILGATAAQGHAIAFPMPEPRLMRWLEEHRPSPVSPTPRTLLGAYAAVMRGVETCRILHNEPIGLMWPESAQDPHSCAVGRFLDDGRLHETAYGAAHRRFHGIIDRYAQDPALWEEIAAEMVAAFARAVAAAASEDHSVNVQALGSVVRRAGRQSE